MFPMLYHTHHTQSAQDIPFWLQIASRFPNPILELGCGTGRVYVPIHAAGHRIIGLDNDFAMLSCLKENARKNLQDEPLVFQADCAEFHCAEKFGLVVLPCNTYSTLDKDRRKATLESVHLHLLPRGAFVTSLANPALLDQLPAKADPEVEDFFLHPVDGEPVQVSSAWEKSASHFILTWHYDHLLPDGKIERTSMTIAHELSSTETFLQEIRSAGFAIIELYGDYDLNPFGQDSPQLIIVAQPV